MFLSSSLMMQWKNIMLIVKPILITWNGNNSLLLHLEMTRQPSSRTVTSSTAISPLLPSKVTPSKIN